MTEFSWGKTLVAVVTPFNAEGEVNYLMAARFCSHLIAQGCDGVVVAGTTGESPTLTSKEKVKLFAFVKDAIGDSGQVIAGIGGNDTKSTLELLEAAAATGVDGYMAVSPYYNKPNPSGLLAHYRAIDAVADRPVMVYNVPSRTGQDIPVTLYEQMFANCPQITAIKEASPDLDKASTLVEKFGEQITLLSGNDNLVLPQMAVGFQGVVSVAGNIVPGLMSKLVGKVTKDFSQARLVHQQLLPLFRALFAETNPVPVKAALELSGWAVGAPRLPLAEANEGTKQKLVQVLGNLPK